MKTIYALLVGIDNYPAPVPKLGGSKKDLHRIREYLEKNFNDRPLHIKTLVEEEATRDNFIKGFQDHLGQAKENDVVWFHYSGHGSRQLSAPEFANVNSGKKDETLVLFDSRPNGQDFADKELAILLYELSKSNAHIIVTLDCCHAGAGTRGKVEYTKRLSMERPDNRTLDQYMDGYYKTNGLTVPEGKYILFAACNRFQSAKESFDGGGLFTQNLIETLQSTDKNISYADLLVKLRQGVVNMKWDQDPQLELVGETDSFSQFLDGRLIGNAPKYAVSFSEDGWTMDAGQILGVTEDVNVALYEMTESLTDTSTPLLITKVQKASAQRSTIAENEKLKKEARYWAKPLNVPDIPFSFALSVSKEDEQKFIERASSFPLVKFHSNPSDQDLFKISVVNENFEVWDKSKNEVILKAKADHPNAISELILHLDQLAFWHRILRLQNNKTNLTSSVSTINIEIENQKYEPGDIELKNNGNKLLYKIWIQNQFTQPLNYALFYLSEAYGITPIKNEPLEKSDSPILFWGGKETDYFILPEGIAASSDTFIIIISTERTDDFQLKVDDMNFGIIPLVNRAVPGLSRATRVKGEWFTNKFVIKLSR